MRMLFDNELSKQTSPIAKLEDYMLSYEWVFMVTWYAYLFTICEFIKSNQINIPDVDSSLRSLYKTLHPFRNAVLHIQSDYYWSQKLFEIYKDETSALKIRHVHAGLGKAFLEEIERRQNLT